MKVVKFAAAAAVMTATQVGAATVNPISYSMTNGGLNGNNSAITYFDHSYSGLGDNGARYSQLSGGTGDLTDGVIATGNYHTYHTETVNGVRQIAPSTPYVGWELAFATPDITFQFDRAYAFNSVTIHYDVAYRSTVGPVGTADVSGTQVSFAAPVSDDPTSGTVSLNGLVTDELNVVLDKFDDWRWVFVSEITFDADEISRAGRVTAQNIAVTPLPGSVFLLIGALGGIAVMRRTRSA